MLTEMASVSMLAMVPLFASKALISVGDTLHIPFPILIFLRVLQVTNIEWTMLQCLVGPGCMVSSFMIFFHDKLSHPVSTWQNDWIPHIIC